MIKRGLYGLLGSPPVVARECSVIKCGCTVLVGMRTDRRPPEVVAAGLPCSSEHQELLERFNLALTDSLVNPSGRPLIDVVDELLVAAAGGDDDA